MSELIDTFEYGYEEWEIHKEADNSYSYQHFPDCTMGADIQYAITITLEDGRYKFDAQKYFEIYGSGGWDRWTGWKDELKDIILKDAMERINDDKNGTGEIDADKNDTGETDADKEIIVEQKKTIKVLQAENIRLTVELRKQLISMRTPKVEPIKKKV